MRAVVVGGANVDVMARPDAAAVPGTSNPGRVTVTPGGVGRNIAENLARLGTPVHLVAAVGSDAARRPGCSGATAAAGVDVEHVRRGPAATGTYIALLDDDGELVAGGRRHGRHRAPRARRRRLCRGRWSAAADLLVLDGNLPPAPVAGWPRWAPHARGAASCSTRSACPRPAALGRLLGPSAPLLLVTPNATSWPR